MKREFKRNPHAEALYRRLCKAVEAAIPEEHRFRRMTAWLLFYRRFYVDSRVDMTRRLRHGIRDYAGQVVQMRRDKMAATSMAEVLEKHCDAAISTDLSAVVEAKGSYTEIQQNYRVHLNRLHDMVERRLAKKAGGDVARMMSMRYMFIGRSFRLLCAAGRVPGRYKDAAALDARAVVGEFNDSRSARRDFLQTFVSHGQEPLLMVAADQVSGDHCPAEFKKEKANVSPVVQ